MPKIYFLGALALWLLAASPMAFNIPSLAAPFCILVVIPILLLNEIAAPSVTMLCSTIFLPVIFFCYGLFIRNRRNIPSFTKIFSIFAVLCSIYWLVAGWHYGAIYQGKTHVIWMYIYNAIFLLGIFMVFLRNLKSPSYMSNFIFHWLLFAWLAWIAFPWLGELP